MYLNLKSTSPTSTDYTDYNGSDRRKYFRRIIFHTEDVDKLYSYLRNNEDISNTILFEDKPNDAPWGKRYFSFKRT
jgi:hypothetical protein